MSWLLESAEFTSFGVNIVCPHQELPINVENRPQAHLEVFLFIFKEHGLYYHNQKAHLPSWASNLRVCGAYSRAQQKASGKELKLILAQKLFKIQASLFPHTDLYQLSVEPIYCHVYKTSV